MPENPTIKEVLERLEKYISVAENTHNLFIASLWVTEAKVIVETLRSNEWILE